MKPPRLIFLFTLALAPMICSQDKPKTTLPPECTKTIWARTTLPKSLKIPHSRAYKGPPTLKFQIQEDGSITNVSIMRSSGVPDFDQQILQAFANWKYKPRPAGCGIIENTMALTIDLQD
jgi:TonB family protein